MSKVAICVATYKRPEYLAELFASIQKQTFNDYTLYVLGNVAPVGTAKKRVVEMALADNPDYIQMVDDDDTLEPDLLLENLKAIQGYDWCLCWGRTFGLDNGYIQSELPTIAEQLEYNHLHSWGMFRAEVLRKVNFREGLAFFDDWDLWIRILKAGYKGTICQKELYNYRIHGQRLSLGDTDYDTKRDYILKINNEKV